MKRLLSIGVVAGLLALVLNVVAEDNSEVNGLTAKEIANGWILLFDGETTFGWTSPSGSDWTISRGMLAPRADKPGLLVSTTAFTDYELSFEYQSRQSYNRRPRFEDKDFDFKDKKDGGPKDGGVPKDGGRDVRPDPKLAEEEARTVQVRVGCNHLGEARGNDQSRILYQTGGWLTKTLTVVGGEIRGESERYGRGFRGDVAMKVPARAWEPGGGAGKDTDRSGHIALAGNGVVFRSVKLRPLHAKSLFNGKDLKGWKVFEGEKYKSKFFVTPHGWLNVKNGPGDLATETQYSDFLLQLECMSNGKHLNSGIFFRAKPNEYQVGYEAQIRNEFTAETREYTLDVYDPKTNEKKESVKVKSPAVDFGTGAIYRRQPARKQMSKDNEWFAMTVVAHGRHMATWVNGVQVADWTDHRPLTQNARTGYCMNKGTISIQGHDPTTDLSFRKLRVVDYTVAAPEDERPPRFPDFKDVPKDGFKDKDIPRDFKDEKK